MIVVTVNPNEVPSCPKRVSSLPRARIRVQGFVGIKQSGAKRGTRSASTGIPAIDPGSCTGQKGHPSVTTRQEAEIGRGREGRESEGRG